MLPSISSILNPPDSSTLNHQITDGHQLPRLIPPPVIPTPFPSTANPMHPTPMHGQTRLPSPAEILNLHHANMPAHFNPTLPPIAYYSGQPIETAHRMFRVPFDDRCQLRHPDNLSYLGNITPFRTDFQRSRSDHPINTGAATLVTAGMSFKHIPGAENRPDTIYTPSFPFLNSKTRGVAPIAAVSHSQLGANPLSANPKHDTRGRPILLAQTHNAECKMNFQKPPQETQHSAENSSSTDQTSHLLSSVDGQPSSAASTTPNSSSPDTFSTPQTEQQEGTHTNAPVISSEPLFPSMEELQLRKLHFSHNKYPPAVPVIAPNKRIRSESSFSYERSGQESLRSDTDSNSNKQFHCKRIKIAKTSEPASKLLLDFANSSRMDQDDSSPGSDRYPSTDCKRLANTPGSSKQSPVERQEASLKCSDHFSPDARENTSHFGYESVPTKRSSYRRRTYTSKTLSKSGHASKQAEPTEVSCAKAKEVPASQIQLEVTHTLDQLIMQANTIPNTHRCDECNATFANEDSIARHKRAQHTVASRAGQMVKCPKCSLLLRNKQNLKRHLTTHGPTANHKCKECTAKFITERARTTHMRDVHGRKAEQRSVRDNSTSCPIKGCTYASNQKTNVKRHYENKHLNIKRFHCILPSCTYVGSTRANRQAHMKTHEKETERISQDFGQ